MIERPETINRLAIAILARVELFMAEYDAMINWREDRDSLPPAESHFALHFTSAHVAESVLANNELWLMDATTSNDREERVNGIRVMRSILRSAWNIPLAEAQSLPVEDITEFRPAQLDRMGHVLRGALLDDDHPLGLILCLSKPELGPRADFHDWAPTPFDNLAMWREYGSDGDGVCLALDYYSLAASMRPSGCGAFPVLYELSAQERACRFLIVAALEFLRERDVPSWTKHIAGVPDRQRIAVDTAIAAAKLAAQMMSFLLKHPAFAYEREIRLLCCRSLGDVHTFTNPETGVQRYYTTTKDLGHTDELPIVGVCTGPRASDHTHARIDSFCSERAVSLRHSSAPYRGRDAGKIDLIEFREEQDRERRPIDTASLSTWRKLRDDHWELLEEQARRWNEENLPKE